MGLRQLLDIVEPFGERVLIVLGQTDPQHVQYYLRVLGIVLVPAVVQCFSGSGQGHRGDQPQFDTGLKPAPDQRPVIVAGGLETGND